MDNTRRGTGHLIEIQKSDPGKEVIYQDQYGKVSGMRWVSQWRDDMARLIEVPRT
jgi:hypothetical protein